MFQLDPFSCLYITSFFYPNWSSKGVSPSEAKDSVFEDNSSESGEDEKYIIFLDAEFSDKVKLISVFANFLKTINF